MSEVTLRKCDVFYLPNAERVRINIFKLDADGNDVEPHILSQEIDLCEQGLTRLVHLVSRGLSKTEGGRKREEKSRAGQP